MKKPRPNPLADAPVSGAVLQADRVSLAAPWGSGYLLQDLSFKLGPGELVALIGPSGSGKTTLLRLLNFLLEPTTGTIALNGENIRDLSVIQLRRRVGLLLQEAKLLGMTVGQAIAYPLQLRGYPRAEVERQVEYWRERLQIPTAWLERKETQLSAGQRQLVAIARILVGNPQVLLLDEPTASLDLSQGLRVVELLRELVGNQSMTVLMVNHQLDLAQQFCDRVLYLQGGRILKDVPSAGLDWLELKDQLAQSQRADTEVWT